MTSLPPPRRSLGQVFLNSERVINRIVSSLDLSLEDTVIEIGPGRGALTNNLIGACGRLVLVEKDDVLAVFTRNVLQMTQALKSSIVTQLFGIVAKC